MASRRGGISFSINMLVVVIISLVVLGMGVALLYQFVDSGNRTKEQLDQRTQQELQRLLIDKGQRVALPLKTATLYAGESHIFGLGILNIDPDSNSFYIVVEKTRIVDEQGQDITDSENPEGWFLYTSEAITLDEQEHHVESILVEVPIDAPKGQYIMAVKVFTTEALDPQTQYGNTQQVVVKVT